MSYFQCVKICDLSGSTLFYYLTDDAHLLYVLSPLCSIHCLNMFQYNLLYQDLKRFSKNGEHFCKELMSVFQQRAELEISYSKGLQKLAGKLIKASTGMVRNSTYVAWSHVSDEMYSTADVHRTLGNAIQQEAILEIRQILEEHAKRKRPLDNAVEKTGKLVVSNWNEQLKCKKKLIGLTREHEALFSFVENNKQMCTEKEKQKMLNRLTKSAEVQARADEEYFTTNLAGQQFRLKWESTLKNCYQVVQELEKQRIEILCNILNKYNLYMISFGQTLIHCQKQIDQAIRKVDVEKDIQMMVEQTSVTAKDSKAEFLLADYFEEDSKTVMGRDRRREAIRMKLHRIEDHIIKTKKDQDGLERMIKTYTENPSFSNKKNLEETEQLLDETALKLELLEATYCKLSTTMAELEGKPKSSHRFSDRITKWKDKDYEHSIVQLVRPVKIRKIPFRSRMSLRLVHSYEASQEPCSVGQMATSVENMEPKQNHESNGQHSDFTDDTEDESGAELPNIGKCKALYDFISDREDELNIKEGDLLDILEKNDNGWWYGSLNSQKGYFPSTYVEELPTISITKSFDV
ncbi:nostrin isoform X2 [Scleropages formosus]|uniref:Osteoclast-stimulating factor 1 n=1 Tax=Scleropages formosus TaxID=113540 RepID=A0A8C9SDS7_SCLFO|nr:nostrin isoform X2 [Scleropages formosus]